MPTTILCVNNDERMLMAHSLILSIAGYDVQTAASGDSAIRLFARYDVDVVVAEHSLPVINGVQFTRLMKEVEPEVQVVLLADTRQMPFLAEHAEFVLPKSAEPEQLLAALKMLIGRRRPRLVPTYKKVANLN